MSQTVIHRLRRQGITVATAIWLICLVAAPLAAQPKPRVVTSKAAPERTHQLFVGVDLFVPNGLEMMQVRNIEGRTALVASEAGQLEEIERTSGFRWKLVPKVSNQDAAIADLEYETTYSPASDPYKQWVGRQTNIMNYQQDQAMMTELRAVGASSVVMAPSPDGDGMVVANDQDVRPELMNALQSGLSEQAMLTDMTSPDTASKEIHNRGESQGHDAVELRFSVSAPSTMSHAYCVALARVRLPNGTIDDVNFYKPIGEIGPRPRKITMLQTGIPPDSEILEVKLHLFNSGKELATNLSEKRFELTEEEARQYLLLDHTANHRGETLPACAVWELAPPELKAAPSSAPLDQPILVKIDAQGQFVGFASDDQIVSAAQRDIIKNLVYLPALEDGQAIESTVAVNLADYFR